MKAISNNRRLHYIINHESHIKLKSELVSNLLKSCNLNRGLQGFYFIRKILALNLKYFDREILIYHIVGIKMRNANSKYVERLQTPAIIKQWEDHCNIVKLMIRATYNRVNKIYMIILYFGKPTKFGGSFCLQEF